MNSRSDTNKFSRYVAIALVFALVATGCAGSSERAVTNGGRQPHGIDEHDPRTLEDGGNLRLPIYQFPGENFNPLHYDTPPMYVGIVAAASYPRAFTVTEDGSLVLNTDYFTAAEQNGDNPQVVTYTINPNAVWTDGSPLTWQDIASQIHALSGVDRNYDAFTIPGYDRVLSVTRGANDQQAVITFKQPFAEWRGMFSGGNVLLPRAMTATPEAFADGQKNAPGPSAGPFVVTQVDRQEERIVLSRNPKWWGREPRLDTMTLITTEPAGALAALHDHEIDALDLTTAIQVAAAERMPGVIVHRVPASGVRGVFYTACRRPPGATSCTPTVLADPALRRAITRGIDREALIKVTQRGLTDTPVASNNHIFFNGQKGYRDNSADADYDPDRARKELDALGWKLNRDGIREKDGQTLTLSDTYVDEPAEDLMAQQLEVMLAGIGVDLELKDLTAEDWGEYSGPLDLFQWTSPVSAFPLSMLQQNYSSEAFSSLGLRTPELDDKIDQALGENGDNAFNVADEVDKLLWAEAHSVPILRSPSITAVDADIVNFRTFFGLADTDYTAVGIISEPR